MFVPKLSVVKKISLSVAVGAFLPLFPLLASAQSTDIQTQLAGLAAQLALLQQQLAQLQSGGSTNVGTNVVTTNVNANINANVNSNASCPSPLPTRTLSRGSFGPDVAALQDFLVARGYLASGNVTAFFGPLTEAAVQRFQAAYGLVSSGTPSTTGYGGVGPLTRAKIIQLCAPTQHTQTYTTQNIQNVLINSFTVSPASITAGQQAIISWNVQYAGGCVLSQQGTGQNAVTINANLPLSGSVVATPSLTTIYTILCTAIGVQGLGASQSLAVAVQIPAPTGVVATLTLAFDPAIITAGQSSMIKWSAIDVSSCSLTTSTGKVLSTAFSGAQTYTFTKVGTTVVDLKCVGTDAKNYSTSASLVGTATTTTVTPNITFTATPTSGTVPLAVTFTANTGGTTYFGGLQIDFGDGATSTLLAASCASCNATTSHIYTATGIYTAILMGIGEGSTTALRTVVINAAATTTATTTPGTTISLVATPDTGVEPLTVTFTGFVIGANYTLIYGDGSQVGTGNSTCPSTGDCKTTVNKTHTYTKAGTYSATLISSCTSNVVGSCTFTTVTIVVTSAVPPTITITSPSAGTTLKAGSSATVTWTSTGLSNNFNLWMLWDTTPECTVCKPVGSVAQGIATNVPGYTYTWTIPANTYPGNFKIQVQAGKVGGQITAEVPVKITNSSMNTSTCKDIYGKVWPEGSSLDFLYIRPSLGLPGEKPPSGLNYGCSGGKWHCPVQTCWIGQVLTTEDTTYIVPMGLTGSGYVAPTWPGAGGGTGR